MQQRKIGIMGSQTKEKAFACLEKCPLLEDLSDWSHWDLVFKPELGSLKDFVQKHGGTRTFTVTGECCRDKWTPFSSKPPICRSSVS